MKSSCRRRRRINYVTVTEEPASCLLLLGRDKQKHLHINFSLWRHDLLMYLFVWINYYQNIFSSLRYLQRTCYATGIEKFNCNRNHLHMQNLTILCLSKKRKKYAHLNICKLVNPFSLCATTVASFTLSLILIFFCLVQNRKEKNSHANSLLRFEIYAKDADIQEEEGKDDDDDEVHLIMQMSNWNSFLAII